MLNVRFSRDSALRVSFIYFGFHGVSLRSTPCYYLATHIVGLSDNGRVAVTLNQLFICILMRTHQGAKSRTCTIVEVLKKK